MRQPQQQNRRGRGRTGRKPQNSLARSYESNGPDVKIRGTAAHIAEKYTTLARDALASGDLVAAESYFQHAEHYNRIIMAAQAQFGPQHGGQPGEGPNGGYRPRWDSDDDGSEEGGPMSGGPGSGGGDEMRGSGGREHSGGREQHYGRRGPNGSEAPARDGNGNANGGESADASPSDESGPDPVG
jgi:hypothetical protein